MDRDDERSVAAVAYPMVDEAAAVGEVASVYARILERLPLVPSVFKSLAVCPGYLSLAWAQAEGALADRPLDEAAHHLVEQAAGTVPPADDHRVREALGRFVDALGRMLLVTGGLRLALAGATDGPPARRLAIDPQARPHPELDVPPTDRMDPQLVGRIRSELATPIVNSIWRHADAIGVLADAWRHLSPHTRSRRSTEASGALHAAAIMAARSIEWPVVASPEALEREGLVDAAPGMSAVLDAYEQTLPRVLVLVAGNSPA